MNQYSMGLTIAAAVLGSCAVYADLLARRIRDFLLVARSRHDDVSMESGWNVDEMLVAAREATATNFWNSADRQVEQITQKIASPFGDW